MSQIIQEKRRFPRKTPEQIIVVLDNDTDQSLGVLDDVSKGGFSILTDSRVRPAETRSVTLVLPGPREAPHRVKLTAECVWCQTISGQAMFAAGFVLRSINDQNEVALNYYIRDYQVASKNSQKA